MSHKIEAIPDSWATVGEGPHWDIESQSLFYVDVNTGWLLRYDFRENKVYKSKIEGEDLAGFITPIYQKCNQFAVGCGRKLQIISWDGIAPTCKVIRTLFEVQPEDKYKEVRFNDGKCDPQGRLFVGTMKYGGDEWSSRLGMLFKYTRGGKVEMIKDDIGISNGLCWNEKRKKFYFIDTTDYDVKEYDYDIKTGVICNPKIIFDLRKNSKEDHLWPDGMTIDTEGNIYVATFNGSTLYKVDPCRCKVLMEIEMPVKRITSCAWGGPNLDILFVTTSDRFGEQPPAGTTYKITNLGARGEPMTRLKL